MNHLSNFVSAAAAAAEPIDRIVYFFYNNETNRFWTKRYLPCAPFVKTWLRHITCSGFP